MEGEKKNWEEPIITHIDELPLALGHCTTGTTPGATWCGYGDDTGGGGHRCLSGGIGKLQCSTGTTP